MKNNTKKLKRLTSLILAGLMLGGTGIISHSADIEVINGSSTAFVASFGKLNYEGKARTAFKSVGDAINTLGESGGTIVFNSEIKLDGVNTINSKGTLALLGQGTVNTACAVNFGESNEFKLAGDLVLDFLTFKNNASFVIDTEGKNFTAGKTVDAFYTVKYPDQTREYNEQTYPSIRVDAGSELTIEGGRYKSIALGDGAGDVELLIRGGNVSEISLATSTTLDGSAVAKITNGTIKKLVLGNDAKNSIKGNAIIEINGGELHDVTAGSSEAIGGNLAIISSDMLLSTVNVSKASASGKVILISDREIGLSENSSYDHYVLIRNGKGRPIFDGINLLGFSFADSNGLPATGVTINGTPAVIENGIVKLPEGKAEVVLTEASTALKVNREASYVSGYSDGTFLPDATLSRAEAITMLARLIVEDSVVANVCAAYEDVSAQSWYKGYIGLFQNLGFLDSLDSALKILPDEKITRAQFCELAVNIIKVINPLSYPIKQFSDVPKYHKHYRAVGEVGSLGIVGGYEDGTFRPDNNITRAEVVTIINRMLSRTPTGNSGGRTFSDTQSHWASSQIVMAANPKTVDSVELWSLGEIIGSGGFKLAEADSISEQIEQLYVNGKDKSELYFNYGVNEISNWQIDKILNSPSDYSTITGTKYYVSPNGNDSNDGKSPETAWKTLAAVSNAPLSYGDGVLFERGATWRGSFRAKSGITYSAYGTGDKPRIYGSQRNYSGEEQWVKTKYNNVWECSERIGADVGVMVFNTYHEHGNYNEITGKKLVGNGFEYADGRKLDEDLEFLNTSSGKLYLYSDENPGKRFHTIEIGTKVGIVSIQGDDIVIDNLHFRYTGAHVIGTGNRRNITTRNCVYAYAGGSVLSGTTLYGNAFESYGGCDGWYAYDNWIYQIFDTGVTHQFTPTTGDCVQKNVEYSGNVIELCHWSIEYYNNDSTDGSTRRVENIKVHDNICRLNGYGWGSRGRSDWSTMFCSAGITQYTFDFVASRNIFDRSAGRIVQITSIGDEELVLDENIYIQKEDAIFGYGRNQTYVMNDVLKKTFGSRTKEAEPLLIYNNDAEIINNIKVIK